MASPGVRSSDLRDPAEKRGRPGRVASAAAVRAHEEEQRRRALIRMASHELRTPLNAIIGFSEIIASELYGPIADERYREHAEVVRQSGLKLLRLVNQVMDLARLESGAADIRVGPEPVRPILEQAVAAATPDAEARRVTIRLTCERASPVAQADPRALATAVGNLLQNAVAYSFEGGVVIVRAEEDEGLVHIRIEDHGEGVDPGELPRLMRPFEQGESALSRRREGAGLGLPIARLLIRAMGGVLALASRPGEGLTAEIRLRGARDGEGADAAA